MVHGIWSFPAGFLAVLLGKILRLPSMVTLPGGDAACVPQIGYGNLYKPQLRRITLWTCRHAGELIVLTNYQAQALRKFGLKRKHVCVIPFGADKNRFQPQEKRVSPPSHFLHVANLTEVKDQKTLLRAFALINPKIDCRLRMVGPDYLNGALQQFAKDLGISSKVEFLGRVAHQQLPAHYAWAHVMLHTSYYEGQGVVIAEAAASGVVVCGTRVGLLADWGDRNAVCVDVGDYLMLAEKVLDLIQDIRRFETVRANALRWAETHDAEWTAKQYVHLYHKLLLSCSDGRQRGDPNA